MTKLASNVMANSIFEKPKSMDALKFRTQFLSQDWDLVM